MESIVPFEGEGQNGEFFDDCPICQQLKRDLEEGKIERLFEKDDEEPAPATD